MPGFAGNQGPGGGARGGQGRGCYGAGMLKGTIRNRGSGQPSIISRGSPPRWGYGPWGFGISLSGRKTGYTPRRNEAEALRCE